MLRVKPADKEDAKALATIGARTFYDTFRPYNTEEDMQLYIAKAYNETIISANLGREDIYYALCYEEDEVVGYIKLIKDTTYEGLKGKSIEMEKIYVLSNYHGKAAGKELMEHAINYAAGEGFDVLFLGVWEENSRAVSFYKKSGFEMFATRKFQLGNRICDDYMMKLDLKNSVG